MFEKFNWMSFENPADNMTDLFNNERGAVGKEKLIALFDYSLANNLIRVERAEIVTSLPSSEIRDLTSRKGKELHMMLQQLRTYHQESDSRLAHLVYFVENEIEKQHEYPKFKLGHRFEKSNAESRIYFESEHIGINSDNDDIETLIETLDVMNGFLFILGRDQSKVITSDINIYKLEITAGYREVREKLRKHNLDEMFSMLKKLK